MSHFSSETTEVRKQWRNVFKILSEEGEVKRARDRQTRNLYQVKMSFKNENELKIFWDKEEIKYLIKDGGSRSLQGFYSLYTIVQHEVTCEKLRMYVVCLW